MQAQHAPQFDINTPAHKEILLILIREELKARKLFKILNALGCHDITYQTDLSELVLIKAGFQKLTGDLYLFYFDLLHKYCKKLNGNDEVVMQQVMKVYNKLMIKKAEADIA